MSTFCYIIAYLSISVLLFVRFQRSVCLSIGRMTLIRKIKVGLGDDSTDQVQTHTHTHARVCTHGGGEESAHVGVRNHLRTQNFYNAAFWAGGPL